MTLAALDNPAWNAIRSMHASLAKSTEVAARYQASVSVFAAIANPGRLQPLNDLVPKQEIVVLVSQPGKIAAITSGWREIRQIPLHQMVCDNPAGIAEAYTGRLLDESDYADMQELARQTDPGPFEAATGRMGDYFGVDGNDGLIAMAGERFRMPGWVEVSGVCTNVEARGKGYAYKLVARVMKGIADQDSGAFLHVRIGSPSESVAIALYERLGFRIHQPMVVQLLERI
jgi:hypothetical protein